MNTMITENEITFKEIEKKIYEEICALGQECTTKILEGYDHYLMESRDKTVYRHKGYKHTTVKTVYGEVEYKRAVYEVLREDGIKEHVFLLDEQLKIEGVGLISQNLAEKLVSGITELSYRECAKKVSETTGQTISAMGVWNVIQGLGDAVCREEEQLVADHKAGKIKGETVAKLLFEETDGVYIRYQREKLTKGEIKVGIAYDGWKKVANGRYQLDGKVVVAGISTSAEFNKYREAAIAEKYDTDETELRIMNADGSEWIKNVCDADTLFQLDPFHKNKAIKEKIHNKAAVSAMMDYLAAHDIDGMFEYLEMYTNSLEDDKDIEDAKELSMYLKNNRQGLIPYQNRGINLPENGKGLVYRNMGTMENHIWSIIAKRMKHNHSSWSIKGGNHLAKILAKKCCGRLGEVADKLKCSGFRSDVIEELKEKAMSAATSPSKDGKGYEYAVQGRLAMLNNKLRGSREIWRKLAGF